MRTAASGSLRGKIEDAALARLCNRRGDLGQERQFSAVLTARGPEFRVKPAMVSPVERRRHHE